MTNAIISSVLVKFTSWNNHTFWFRIFIVKTFPAAYILCAVTIISQVALHLSKFSNLSGRPFSILYLVCYLLCQRLLQWADGGPAPKQTEGEISPPTLPVPLDPLCHAVHKEGCRRMAGRKDKDDSPEILKAWLLSVELRRLYVGTRSRQPIDGLWWKTIWAWSEMAKGVGYS